MNSANSSDPSAIEHYPVPRILKENDVMYNFEQTCSSACCNESEDEDDDPLQFQAELDSKSVTEEPANPRRHKESVLSLPLMKTKNNTGGKRRRSIVDWIKGSPKDFDPFKTTDTETSSEFLSSSTCSVSSSSEESPISAIPPHLRNRRRSSITKTLKSGKDALVATAKRLRKLSR